MDQNKKHGKKCPVLNKIKNFLTSQIRLDARLLEFMQDHPEITPDSDPIEAPPGEFEKIMAEMNARGIKPAIRRELAVRKYFKQAGRYMQRPAFVALLVVLILGGTSAGVSAKKAYDYRIKVREAGKSNIVWNNDQYVISPKDDLTLIYDEISEQLEIKPLKLMYIPFGMEYESAKIENGLVTIKFKYGENDFWFIMAKQYIATSSNLVSDRAVYQKIYNEWLEKDISIERNKLEKGIYEFSSEVTVEGTYYYLSGIISEDEFVNIIINLNY